MLRFHRGSGGTGGYMSFTVNNGTERMRLNASGRLGIGTTSPKAKLQVNGSLIVNTYSSNQGGTAGIFFREANSPGGTSSNHLYNCSIMNYAHADTTSSDGISINGYDGVSICTGSNTRNERMRIASNGYVGIGTPSPTAALSVVGGRVDGSHSVGCHLGQVTSRAFLEMCHGTGGQIDFATGDGSNDYKGRIDYTHSDNRMSFGTNGISGRVNIDSNGYLGIGTTSPTHLLTVGQGISETGGTTSMAILAPGENADYIVFWNE